MAKQEGENDNAKSISSFYYQDAKPQKMIGIQKSKPMIPAIMQKIARPLPFNG